MKIIAAFPHGVITVPANQRIAELISVPLHPLTSKFIKSKRGQSGFGSSGVYWVQSITSKRPNLKLTIEGKRLEELIDTGADVKRLAFNLVLVRNTHSPPRDWLCQQP